MLEFARWKYILIAVVLLLTALYSLPNLYPKDPAVQVTANRGATLDAALVSRVQTLLKANSLPFKKIALEGPNLMVRLVSTDLQSQAANLIRPTLGSGYTVALNLASNVPGWLQAVGGKPMSLGLDLQGGVQFLMEVDQKAAIEKRSEAFLDEIRAVLRENQIAYTSVSRNASGIHVLLRRADDVS